MENDKIVLRKSKYCTNCSKYGHTSNKCTESITSLGIICVKFNNLLIDINDFKKNIFSKYIDIDNYNFSNIDNIDKLELFKDNIKFLMIERKHSLSYVEFIRGKYNCNDYNEVSYLFKNMCKNEIDIIKDSTFDNLWKNLWKKTSNNQAFQKEYRKSKASFQKLIINNYMDKLLQVDIIYDSPEWGFPKGRKNFFERNFECAVREFNEETSISDSDITILTKINCINEEYIGSNNQKYRHIYYTSIIDNDNITDDYLKGVCNNEVGCIRWLTRDEAIEIIRPIYQEKIKIINQVYFLFLNLYIEYLVKNHNMIKNIE